MSERTYWYLLMSATLGFALIIAIPFVTYFMQPEYQGLIPMRTLDDGTYYSHIQSAVLGRYDEISNSITSPEFAIQGTSPGLQELFLGSIFSWTGLRGPEVSALSMILLTPLIIPLLALLFGRWGTKRGVSLAAACVYSCIFLAPLQRPVNLSLALPLCVLCLLLIALTWQRKSIALAMGTGVLLAILPGAYFWVWTFVWLTAAILFLLDWLFVPQSSEKDLRLRLLLLMGGVALLVSLPILVRSWYVIASHPLFEEVAYYRSSIYPTHAVDSIPRALLLLAVVFSVVWFLRRKLQEHPALLFPASMVIAIFIAQHQNLIHGKDFSFSPHYYPFVCLSVVALSTWVLSHYRPVVRSVKDVWHSVKTHLAAWITVGVTAIFLLAAMWDYRIMWHILFAAKNQLQDQHLASVLEQLHDETRQTVLTDLRTGLLIKSWTDDDIVWVQYMQHLLVSNAEFARRACTISMFEPAGPDIESIAFHTVQFEGMFMLPDRVRQFSTICQEALQHKSQLLKEYGVDLLLWNERQHPNWAIDPALFEQISEGEGWSLWKIRP